MTTSGAGSKSGAAHDPSRLLLEQVGRPPMPPAQPTDLPSCDPLWDPGVPLWEASKGACFWFSLRLHKAAIKPCLKFSSERLTNFY